MCTKTILDYFNVTENKTTETSQDWFQWEGLWTTPGVCFTPHHLHVCSTVDLYSYHSSNKDSCHQAQNMGVTALKRPRIVFYEITVNLSKMSSLYHFILIYI